METTKKFFIFQETEHLMLMLDVWATIRLSPNTVSEAAEVTYQLLCSTCVTYWTPLVTKCFRPNACLRKQRICLRVKSIWAVCLCSHSSFTCRQKVLVGRSDLCVRDSYRLLYQPPPAGFELTKLLHRFYPPGHRSFR